MDAPARATCSAKSKRSGARCRRRPHPGADKCVMHGGKGSGRPIEHGRYSETLKGVVRDGYLASRLDPNLLDLREPLAAMDGLLKATAARLQDGDTPEWRESLLAQADLVVALKGHPDGEAGKALNTLFAMIRTGVSVDRGESVLLERFERLSKRMEEANKILAAKQNSIPAEKLVGLFTSLLAMLPPLLERIHGQSPAEMADAIADAIWKHIEGSTNGPVRALESMPLARNN